MAAKVAAKTANHERKAAKMLFKAARREGLLAEDPAEFVETVKQNASPARRPFSVPELRAILEVTDGEWRSTIIAGLYGGQRLSDAATLR